METNNSENKGYYSNGGQQSRSGFENNNNNSKILGIVIVVIGLMLLLRATNLINNPFMYNIVSFPTLMIVLGLVMGYKNKFNVGGWVFVIGVGVYFLLRKFDYNLGRYALPLVLIAVGLFVLTKNRQRNARNQLNIPNQPIDNDPYGLPPTSEMQSENAYQQYDAQGEYTKIDSIFSSNERVILSNNFKGGKVGTVFGGVVLDCKSANIQQDIVIDVYSVFGGIELIFPANWHVINETTTIFGAVEDKRRLINNTGSERRVILTGFTLFGGIEIKNL